jgi:4-diphosphocytidyl-2-C-methyl-D-erythritol kinase
MPAEPLRVEAFAKLNLTFEVLGRRGDGYHEVKTILQTINLADRLEFEYAPTFSIACDFAELQGESNLVWRAASALARSRGIQPRAAVRLHKRIPMAMGLGGGSSDAAAALRALDRLWDLGCAPEELAEVAAGVGSDVAFFLWGGTALGEGRGERISPLPPLPPVNLTLVFPDLVIPDKTRTMYSRLTPANYSDGGVTSRMLQILSGRPFAAESIRGCIYNAFQDIADWEFPELAKMRRETLAHGGPVLHLCGAGPALFALPSSEMEHQRVADALQPLGAGVYLVTTVSPPEDSGASQQKD